MIIGKALEIFKGLFFVLKTVRTLSLFDYLRVQKKIRVNHNNPCHPCSIYKSIFLHLVSSIPNRTLVSDFLSLKLHDFSQIQKNRVNLIWRGSKSQFLHKTLLIRQQIAFVDQKPISPQPQSTTNSSYKSL